MKVYVVLGYVDESRRTDNEVFGVYTNRKQAEKKMVAIARKAFDEIDEYITSRGGNWICDRVCNYYNGEFYEIVDESDYQVDVRIEEAEFEDN